MMLRIMKLTNHLEDTIVCEPFIKHYAEESVLRDIYISEELLRLLAD